MGFTTLCPGRLPRRATIHPQPSAGEESNGENCILTILKILSVADFKRRRTDLKLDL